VDWGISCSIGEDEFCRPRSVRQHRANDGQADFIDPMIREPNVKRLLAANMAQQDNIAL
jgi:hypothetical protein